MQTMIIIRLMVVSSFLLISCNSKNDFKKCLPENECNKNPIKGIKFIISKGNISTDYIDIEIKMKSIEKEKYFYLENGNKDYFINYPIEDSVLSTEKNRRFYIYNSNVLFEGDKKKENIGSTNKFYYYIENDKFKEIVCNLLANSKIISQDARGRELNTYCFNKNSKVEIEKMDITI